ncbi:MAG: glycosyltransferase family 4 protein [Pseudorhodoplanes sp.]|uniref:glycosyltransferase family 4 protein n=1 Tax=Pseudorhodoplanes sp. TaxID=1934341 RepID=UPI003D0CF067
MPIKIVYLWGQWTGYMAATVEAIKAAHPSEVRVMVPDPMLDPQSRIRLFNLDALGRSVDEFVLTEHEPTYAEVKELLERVQPDIVVVSGWNYRGYMRAMRENAGRFVRALSMDNQWSWKLKQVGGLAASPVMLHPCFDVVFASGARQRRFAAKLGFAHSRIYEGYLSCDWPLFSAQCATFEYPEKFLFAGRIVDDKGIEELVRGYRLYRSRTRNPWPLDIIGTGPLESTVRGEAGIELKPFKQPAELAAAFREASCFILPSKIEPWGVVLHEAASAGLPLISSAAVGSGDIVLRHGWNGLLLDRVDEAAIAEALGRMAALDRTELKALGARSRQLARDLTPEIWAETFWRCYGTASAQPASEAAAAPDAQPRAPLPQSA